MLSDRMVDALNQLDIRDAESVRAVQAHDPPAAGNLPALHAPLLVPRGFRPAAGEGALPDDFDLPRHRPALREIRDEIEDMSAYLETDTLRRQANTVVRLTVVTAFGLIGTVVTGFLGMNLFALADTSPWEKLAISLSCLYRRFRLTFYTIVKSKRLSDFLEALSDERLPASAKLGALLAVWQRPRRRKPRS